MTSERALYLRDHFVGASGVDEARERLRQGRADRIITIHQASQAGINLEPRPTQDGLSNEPDQSSLDPIPVLHYATGNVSSLAMVSMRPLGATELRVDVGLSGNSRLLDLDQSDAFSWDSLFYTLKRLAGRLAKGDTWHQYASLLGEEIKIVNDNQIDALLMRASTLGRASLDISSRPGSLSGDLFESLILARNSLQRASRKLSELDQRGTPLAERLNEGRIECDSALSSLASAAMVRMYIHSRHEAEEQAHARRANEEHDLRLAHMAAILIPPALWFGLLGANTLPAKIAGFQTGSIVGLTITVAIAILSSWTGWFMIKRSRPKKG